MIKYGDNIGDVPLRKGDDGLFRIPKLKGKWIGVRSKDNIPCLLDELRPIFHLNRVGTLSCCLDGQQLTLKRFHEGEYYSSLSLPRKYDESIGSFIRRACLLRDLVGLNTKSSSVGVILKGDDESQFVIWYGNDGIIPNRKGIISENVAKRWLSDVSLSETVVEIFGEDVTHSSLLLRDKIEEVLRRVSPSSISLSSLMVDDLLVKYRSYQSGK